MIKCPRREREGADRAVWEVSPHATKEQGARATRREGGGRGGARAGDGIIIQDTF